MLKAAVKMIEEGWKFVHAVADDNGVSAETDRAGAGFRIALADFETALEKIIGDFQGIDPGGRARAVTNVVVKDIRPHKAKAVG